MSSTSTSRQLVRTFVDFGVKDAVLSPGSRSGPLALALVAADAEGLLRLHVRVDEREAAFLALGMAKASRRAVPVITTSGTAVANLHPAMLEALHANIPLIAVTADRPARLRETGANQTTDQRSLFPGVRFLDDPENVISLLDRERPGHLNLELDEPLIEPVRGVLGSGHAVTREAFDLPKSPPLALGPRTVVVAGDDAQQTARAFAEQAGWPLLAEPTSGSRTGDNALGAYRLLLVHSPLASQIERVVSFGHATLSRPVTELLARADIEIFHVGTQATFPVPAGSNVQFSTEREASEPDDRVWLNAWQQADKAATAAIDGVLDGSTPYDVARTIGSAVSADGLLFVGSSNPIRDLDLVARAFPDDALVIGNRGLAGIDGTLSTAIGATLARPSSRAIAYVGDLTFLHGSNGLLIGPDEPRPDLTIVVASDDGGSIFSTLEQGAPEYADAFERVYATPTGADIGALCKGYGVPHRTVAPTDLAAVLEEPSTGTRVLEVPIDRLGRQALTAAIDAAVQAAVQP